MGPPLPRAEQPTSHLSAILQLGLGFWGSKTLLSAVELGLFSRARRVGPLDAEALRERLGLHPRSARDFFDALVALGMLERDGRRATRNTPDDRPLPRPGQAVATSAASWRWRTPGCTGSGAR